jgi:hypothetical protein
MAWNNPPSETQYIGVGDAAPEVTRGRELYFNGSEHRQ